MAVVYALLIMKGMKTFEQVPVNLRQAVKEYLFSMELDENGKPLPHPEVPTEEETAPISNLPVQEL